MTNLPRTATSARALTMQRGYSDLSGTTAVSQYEPTTETVDILSEEAIAEHSVFTIQESVETVYTSNRPFAQTQKITGPTYGALFTNETMPMAADGLYRFAPIDFNQPVLLKYDPADGTPSIGSDIGPKPNTYTIAVGYRGLTVLSKPDTTNNLVWCCRQAGDASTIDNFVVYTKTQIPARQTIAPWTVSSGIGDIYRRGAGNILEDIDPSGVNPGADRTVWNLTALDLSADEFYLAIQDPFGDYWIFASVEGQAPESTLIALIQADTQSGEALLPGQSQTGAIIWNYQNTAPCGYIPSGATATISDPQGANCVLPGEKVLALFRNYTCDAADDFRYEILGSYGLRRPGEIQTDPEGGTVPCNATGNVILRGVNTVIQAENEWGFAPLLYDKDEVWVEYEPVDQKWYIVEAFIPTSGLATVGTISSGYTCGLNPIPIVALDYKDRHGLGCLIPAAAPRLPADVDNPWGFPVNTGDIVEVNYNIATDRWEIQNVPLTYQTVTTDMQQGDCEPTILERKTHEVALYSCRDETVSYEQILTGSYVDVVNSGQFVPDQGTCKLRLNRIAVCVAGTAAADPDDTAFINQNVVLNITDEENCLQMEIADIPIPCAPTNQQTACVVDYYDCPDPQQQNMAPTQGS